MFLNKIHKLFSQINFLNLFKSEIRNLIPELNKRYKVSLSIDKIEFEDIDKNKNLANDSEFLSGFGLRNGRYLLGIHPTAILYKWNKDPRYKKSYKSLELFIKDCACHELFHLYDHLINGSAGNHKDWWVDNYNPRYVNDNSSIDYRRRYANDNIIIDELNDLAYFSYIKAYRQDKVWLADYTRYKDYTRESVKSDIGKYRSLCEGDYLDYIVSKCPTAFHYDMAFISMPLGIYELSRRLVNKDGLCLLINIDLLIKFITTHDLIYLDAIIYAINSHSNALSIKELMKEYKMHKSEV